MDRRIFGIAVEEKARGFLEEKGYIILDKNYRRRGGEIDIVCEKDGTLVFVEVKGRRTDIFGEPFEAVTKKKKRRVAHSAKKWLYEKGLLSKCDVRFDVVSIIRRDEGDEIEHIEDAFRP